MRPGNICECGDHGWVNLTRGYVTIVDADHAPLLSLWNWHATLNHGNAYARRSVTKTINGKRYVLKSYLHHVLMPVPSVLVVDHADGNGLNNKLDNLIPTTSVVNSHRQKKKPSATSLFRGVSAYRQRWRVTLQQGGRQVYVGLYRDEQEAALAYDAAAQRLFGSSALLNFGPARTEARL